MILRLKVYAVALLATFAFAGQHAVAYAKPAKACAALRGLDTDKDGTIDPAEAKQAASALFDKLDKNKDGTLSLRELHGRLSTRDFKAADTDKDGTLSKDEYLALADARFKAADTNGDGTVSCKEAKTRAGRALLRLLK